MNKRSVITLLITICVPLFCYFVLKYFSDGAVTVPRKMLLDEVVEKQKNGKRLYDTLWHQTPNFKLVNQLGDTVHLYDVKNKIIVLDLFFTHCASICPQLTKSMKSLQDSYKTGGQSRLKVDTPVVQFISLSIDPESDSVPQLKKYADRFGVNPDNWWLLTGNRDSIYDFIFEGLKLGNFKDANIDPTFAHTDRFVLLDKNYIMRGRLEAPYSGTDTAKNGSMALLARDIGLLMMEKDKTKPATLFNEIANLWWLWFIIFASVAVFVWSLNKNKN